VKRTVKQILISLLLLTWTTSPLLAQDMRALKIKESRAKEALKQKAAAEKAAAKKAAAKSRAVITADRASLTKAIIKLESTNRRLKYVVAKLTEEKSRLSEREATVTQKLSRTDSMIKELVGVIRVNAKDLDGLITENQQTVLSKSRPAFLKSLAEESRFPGMKEIRAMAKALITQIETTSEVTLQKGSLVNRGGEEKEADILMVGPFTALYRLDGEVGFCNYSCAGNKLYALSRLPSRRLQKEMVRYLEGKSDAVPMDISRGGALRQLTHELKLWEQVQKGGPIVWPILLIFVVGCALVVERTIFLLRQHFDADSLISSIEGFSKDNNWQACERTCRQHEQKPVARVVQAGLSCRRMQREEMENALQEAVLREIAPMERFLSTLGMLAAIAPLLGLLGTVTGMIDTFHVITLHGTGDPRLMSGGISEALVTTMLGLGVAIPLMLSQTLLSRVVETKIGEMEEKAVALVNIVHKYREAS
jgi:biopolymer transport protein ExbB